MINNIYVKYLTDDIEPIKVTDDWIDLRAAEYIELKQWEHKLIPLGVIIKLPDNCEAILAPRSSTFKKWGIIAANGIGVIDNSYHGPHDEWKFSALAFRDTIIHKNDRICQFRILRKQDTVVPHTIEEAIGEDRGGFGSTGSN